jgi:hypothetical protein
VWWRGGVGFGVGVGGVEIGAVLEKTLDRSGWVTIRFGNHGG